MEGKDRGQPTPEFYRFIVGLLSLAGGGGSVPPEVLLDFLFTSRETGASAQVNAVADLVGATRPQFPVSRDIADIAALAQTARSAPPAPLPLQDLLADYLLTCREPPVLGGLQPVAPAAHQWINAISSLGIASQGQPAATDLSDFVAPTAWTPVVSFVTPGDLSVAYTTQAGSYSKVGPLVTFYLDLAFTPTYTTASGALTVSVPPAAPTTGVWAASLRTVGTITWPAGVTTISALVGTTNIQLVGLKSAGAVTSFTTAQYLSGVAYTLRLSGCYF